jgi:DMSO reductase family type II enzyme chaperone
MISPEIDTNPAVSEIDLAYCHAAFYSALAIGFQPPNDETLARLLTGDSKASLISAAAMFSLRHQKQIVTAIEALPNAEEIGTRLASEYHVLFGHTARGQIPPYETEYGNEALFQQPQELGDLMGFYRAFGLTLKTDKHERPDHVSCELEFLMFLALKEAYALEQDNREMLAETRKAEKLFLRDHLARFVPTFTNQLQRETAAGFYTKLARLCLQVVAADCARLQVALGAANLGLRPADDDRVPIACGSGAECAAMPGACAPEEADSI